jgi:TonB family protein
MSFLPIPTSPPGAPEPQPAASHTPENADTPAEFRASDLMDVLRAGLDDRTHPVAALLQAIADAARVLTGAGGVAIALPGEGVVVCRARSGDLAPELGSALNVDSGISGECFRTSQVLRCDDAESDNRVDSEVCRLLGIRSIAAIPLRGGLEAIGILEAFSGEANAFSGEQITLLENLGEIAEAAYQRQLREANAIVVRDSPVNSPTLTRIEVPLAAWDRREQISLAVFDEPPPRARHHYWILSGAVALLFLASGVVWWTWHEPAGENSTTQAASQTHTTPGEAAEPAVLQVLPLKPSASIAAPASNGYHPKGLLQNAANVETAAGANQDANNKTARPVNAAASNMKLPAASGSLYLQPAANRSMANQSTANGALVDPPMIVLASNNGGETLPSLAAETAALPTLDVKVSQGVTAPTIVHKIEPVYPRAALSQRLGGTVTLSALIAEDGSVREVKVVEGDSTLAAAAVVAVRQWRYSPCLLNGKPVVVQKEITIIFKPS